MTNPEHHQDPGARGHKGFAVDWAQRDGAVDELLFELDRRAQSRRRVISAIGAVGLIVVASLGWRHSHHASASIAETVSTKVATPLRQVLADGSLVELNEGAEVVSAFTEFERRVVLTQGEAHFQVAKDATMPFVVAVGKIEVRAVGTEFSVQRSDTSAEILVTEGSVSVDLISAPGDNPTSSPAKRTERIALVEAGNRVMVDATTPVLKAAPVEGVTEAEITRRLAWRSPRLEFSGTPLGEAIVMFNRHNDVQFVLNDPKLGGLRISGFLRADKSETFVTLLETDFGLKAERRGDREIVLRRTK